MIFTLILRSGGLDKTQYNNMKYYWRRLIRNFSNTDLHERSFKSSKRVKRTVMGIWTNSSDSDAGAAHNLQKYPWEVLIFMRLRQVSKKKLKLHDKSSEAPLSSPKIYVN